ATDVEPIAYTLDARNLANNSVVAGATISGSGVINWTPANGQGSSTNRFTSVASDGYLTATNSFLVTVGAGSPVSPLPLTIARTTTNAVVLQWSASPLGWILQQSDAPALSNWVNNTNNIATVGNQNQVTVPQTPGKKYFRLMHP